MKIDNWGYWLVIGVSLVHGLGHGDKVGLVFDYLGQHSTQIALLIALMAVPLLFTTWLAIEHDRLINEEGNS